MSEPTPTDLPVVSILLAARNEEHTILDCLLALHQLDYPPDRLDILIGNDGSADRTAEVVQAFIQDKFNFRLVDISTALPNLNGKANVLAQLARLTRGQFLLTTDADARVPPTWVRAMLRQFGQNTVNQAIGIANGCTTIVGESVGARVLAVECLLVFRLIALAASMGVPLTGVGNNMAVRREAYDAVGGFEGLRFSVVEDYELFQAIVRRGYGFAHRLDPNALVHMLPPPSLGAYLQQRKRWMRGVFDLPLPLLLLALGQYLLGPLLLILAFWLPYLALSMYAGKVLLQTVLLTDSLQRLRQTHLWPYVFLYEPYQAVSGLGLLLYYALPVRVVWKGRVY
ncbi:MAG: glycosyltransferase [Cytophagales bacterium]|nr:MAG: glycosyltransferase [Cytophagales bacterium]